MFGRSTANFSSVCRALGAEYSRAAGRFDLRG